MARIDKFIQAMFQSGYERLIMTSGQKAVMVKGDQERPVTAQPTTVPQIHELIKEIRAGAQDIPGAVGEIKEFVHNTESGAVSVRLEKTDGALKMQIEPAGTGAPTLSWWLMEISLI